MQRNYNPTRPPFASPEVACEAPAGLRNPRNGFRLGLLEIPPAAPRCPRARPARRRRFDAVLAPDSIDKKDLAELTWSGVPEEPDTISAGPRNACKRQL